MERESKRQYTDASTQMSAEMPQSPMPPNHPATSQASYELRDRAGEIDRERDEYCERYELCIKGHSDINKESGQGCAIGDDTDDNWDWQKLSDDWCSTSSSVRCSRAVLEKFYGAVEDANGATLCLYSLRELRKGLKILMLEVMKLKRAFRSDRHRGASLDFEDVVDVREGRNWDPTWEKMEKLFEEVGSLHLMWLKDFYLSLEDLTQNIDYKVEEVWVLVDVMLRIGLPEVERELCRFRDGH